MKTSTYPRQVSVEYLDPLLDPYVVDGPEAPETLENKKFKSSGQMRCYRLRDPRKFVKFSSRK